MHQRRLPLLIIAQTLQPMQPRWLNPCVHSLCPGRSNLINWNNSIELYRRSGVSDTSSPVPGSSAVVGGIGAASIDPGALTRASLRTFATGAAAAPALPTFVYYEYTVTVGKKPSGAQYFLDDTQQVEDALKSLASGVHHREDKTPRAPPSWGRVANREHFPDQQITTGANAALRGAATFVNLPHVAAMNQAHSLRSAAPLIPETSAVVRALGQSVPAGMHALHQRQRGAGQSTASGPPTLRFASFVTLPMLLPTPTNLGVCTTGAPQFTFQTDARP